MANENSALEKYLKEITKIQSLEKSADPRNLNLKRTSYEFYEEGVILGAKVNVPEAREKRRKTLEEKFRDLIRNPQSIPRLTDYAEEIWHDGYHEIAQGILGIALSLNPNNPYAYHLLSRINLDLSEISKRNKKLFRKYAELAEQLAEKGLQIIDEIASRLVEDKLDALSHQGKEWGDFQKTLNYHFSERYSNRT